MITRGKKKFLKQVIAFVMVVCMLSIFVSPLANTVAFAAAPTTYTDILTNSTASVSITSSGGARYFRFIPTATGTYKFYSSANSGDTYGALLNASGSTLTYNDDGAGSLNFLITYDCTAGTTYYIKAYMYGSNTGSYTLNVETVSIDCDCNFIYQSSTSADCENDGVDIYVCSLCGNTDRRVTTPAYGHDYVNGACTRCGFAYTAISEYNPTTGDVFLGGYYIELGISRHGSFGTSTRPTNTGFHSDGALGMIVDGDGWDNGDAPTTGDFFLPDTPEERYIFSYYYSGTKYEYIVADRMNLLSGTWNVSPSVSNQSSGSNLKAVVYGVTQHNIGLEITYSFDVFDKNYKTEVKIINESDIDITNVRFVRSFDPDQDDDIYNTNDTYNKVLANPDSSQIAGDENYAMVVARGERTLDGFFFAAFDTRAFASQGVSFSPDSAYLSGLWYDNHSYPNYATEESIAMTRSDTNGYSCADTGIAITFNLGTITADSDDTLEFYSSLSPNVESDLNDIIPATQPTIHSVYGAQIAHNSVGEGPSIDASVVVGHTISYQWYINDENANVGGTAISGATSANYEVPNRYVAGTFEYYYCVVTATRIDNALYETIVSEPVVVEYLGNTHVFEETSRIEAGCTTNGIINYACACGETKVGIIPATGHNIETTIETQVTCTTDGLVIDRCVNDGCNYEKRTVIHGEHNYAITDRQDAACETPGYVEYTCSNCGDRKYEYFDGAHNYVESARVEPQVDIEGSITYTCTVCGDSYDIILPALTPVLKNSSVLLIQDSLPWAENVNRSLLETLKDRGVVSSYNIINTSALASFDLSQYGVVFIANDQSTAMYERLAANSEKLENYVRAGGNLIYGACDEGWGGCGSLTHALPGGVTTSNYYSVHNYIVNDLHPIVTGVYTDNRSLRDELLKGNYCSHTYFNTNTLPEGSNVILRDANGNPTLVEYNLGDGTVIASGLTWEYFYVRNHYSMTTNYSKYVYDDLVTYMVYMSNTCAHDYEMVETVEATCEENGYTKYVCTICSYEYMSDIVIAPGHNYVETSRTEGNCMVMGTIVYTCDCGDSTIEEIGYGDHIESDWIIDVPATCVEGSRHTVCTVCGVTVRTEIIPAVDDHVESDWIIDVPATCVEGSRHTVCTVCGVTVRTEVIPPVDDHVPSDWIVDVYPTATQTGLRHKVCTVCNAVIETDVMPILARLVIENVEARAGSTVRVAIDVQNNPGIIGALLTIEYDSDLVLVSAEAGSAWNTLNFTTPSNYTNPCNFVWDGDTSADYNDGTIIILTFEVPAGADVDTIYNISASYTHGNMINADLETVDVEIEDGSIKIINPKGDVNNDGVVDVADVITLRRYLAGGYEVTINELAADMDDDGNINVTDIVLLRRFLIG